MESIAVTKPDMGVLQEKHLILSPFGAMAQAFSDELLARNGFEEGQWLFVPLELLREEGPGLPRTPASPSMKVELNLILQALRRTEVRTQQERTVERIVERIIRIREQSQTKKSAPSGPSAKTGQSDRPRPAAAGGPDAGLKDPVQARTVNQMSAHHQSFYSTVNQHIHFTANLRQALSVDQTDRPIRSDTVKSGIRSATFTRRVYGNREYERTVFAPSAQGIRQTVDMPPVSLIKPVTASAPAAPAVKTASVPMTAAAPAVSVPKPAGWEQEGRMTPTARPRDGRSLTPEELTLPGSGEESASAQAAKGDLTAMPDREVTRIAHQITRELTALMDRQDGRRGASGSRSRGREHTERRTARDQSQPQSEKNAGDVQIPHAAAPTAHSTQNTLSESLMEIPQAAIENRAGMPQTLPEGPEAAGQTPLEHPSDEKKTGSALNVWNMIRSTRWLQALRRRRQHDDDTAKRMTADGGKEQLRDTSDSHFKALLTSEEKPEEAAGQKDDTASAQSMGLGDTVQDIRVSYEGQITARREGAGSQPESSTRIPPELTYLMPQEETGGSGTGAHHTAGGSRPAERKRTTESGTETSQAAAESDSGGRGAAIRSQLTQADGHGQAQSGRTAGQEETVPKLGGYARTRLLTSIVQDIRTAGEERAAFEDGAERTQRSGQADSKTPELIMPDDEAPGLLLTFAENARRTDGQPAGGTPAENTKNSQLTGEDSKRSTLGELITAAALRDIRLFRTERTAGAEKERQTAQDPVQGPSGEEIIHLTREPSGSGQTGRIERSAVQTAKAVQTVKPTRRTKADQGVRPDQNEMKGHPQRTADTAQSRFDLSRMIRSRIAQLGVWDSMTQTRGQLDGEAALPRSATGGVRMLWKYEKLGQASVERASGGSPDPAETASGGQLDMAPVRPDGSGSPGLADRIPGYRFVDGLAGMPELAFAEQGKSTDAVPGTRGHGYEVRQSQDNTRALPDWARRFLHDGGAQGRTETAEWMRPARSIATLPTETRQEGISWTAPDYRPPMPIALRERPEPQQIQQPMNVRISDAEIRRTAEKVYRIIEDRIRRERRRLGL